MNEFAVRPDTAFNLLIAGMRIRLHKTTEQLARLLGVSTAIVEKLERDRDAAASLPVGQFTDLMGKLDVQLVARVPSVTDREPSKRQPIPGYLPEIPARPVPEPAPAPVPVPESGRPVVSLQNSDALAHILRMSRAKMGKTQAQVAEEMGINPGTFARHERDGGNVTIDFLSIYAEYFGVDFIVGPRRA